MRLTKTGFTLSAILTLSVNCYAQTEAEKTHPIEDVNAKNPGGEIDVQSFVSHSMPTVLFVHSHRCGPCRRMAPNVYKLAEQKTDTKFVEAMLDGPDAKKIGWSSPLAKQLDIHGVPTFFIYDKDGSLSLKGADARAKVREWMLERGIIQPPPAPPAQ